MLHPELNKVSCIFWIICSHIDRPGYIFASNKCDSQLLFLLLRYELFMEAFDHIAKGIDKIYKQLTKSHTHPLGGTAYLNLENEDEPFLHGIKYTAMPPTKRFRDMEQLSGGEKTVAALALLFAIHR